MAPTRRAVLALSNALLAGSLLPGCLGPLSSDDSKARGTTVAGDPNPNPAVAGGSDIDRLARGNAEFGLNLLSSLAADEPAKNQFVSPYSVSVALAMTYAGARGETRTQMAEALRFPQDGNSLHAVFGETEDRLAASDGGDSGKDVPFQLKSANAIWGQRNYPWRDDFLTTLETYYDAGLRVCDFETNHDEATETINEWVADRTEEKITELLPKNALGPRTRLVLTNAVYFRATWAEPFEKDRTRRQSFAALDGTRSRVPMMRQSESFPYATVDGHQSIELPYVGGEVGMVVVLPEEGTFEEFERSLDADRASTLLSEMESRKGTIALPRFTVESSFELPETLADLGMPVAFSRGADFGGMVDLEGAGEHLRIDDVLHESYVAVDEEGTEAAAATAVEVAATGATLNPFEMTVDRPFLFFVRHRPTGTVLFLGRVVDAAAARPD
ncbi:serpin family protein [Haladaptatus salinisoli]|uniref:serpin family protein n=1 Tax=Haladaptatus salinisoli TaxID=2884876 RepID=UPI001D0BC5D8|nr:serpin family protein [Haladaptatus salinisoli]